MRAQIGTLILATSGVQLANGYFGTFFSLRIAIADFGPSLSGLVLSSYFAGFIVGAMCVERTIGKVGHIRAYAGCAGLVAAAATAMPILVGPVWWLILRTFVGFGCAGLFVTTESWLNAKAAPMERGRVFSIYMVGTFLALAAGQLLIGWTNIEAYTPFNAIAVLFALALIIVCLTRAEPPQFRVAESLPFRRLARAVPIAILGCVVSGLISSAFYALVPAWMQGEGIEQAMIGLIMLVAVLGGFAFQIPIGRLSDRFDRRGVLGAVSLGLTATAVSLLLLPHTLPVVLPASLLFGGLMSALYPVCVAHAHDQMPADRVVGVSSRLILISGIGSVVGPFIGTSIMAALDLDGLLYLIAVAAFTLAIGALGSFFASTAAPRLARPFDLLTPQPMALAHDPAKI